MPRLPIPTIETDRLVLRPFSDRHLTQTYVGWLADTDIVRYSENRHRSHDLESCRNYWDAMRDGGHYFWAIEWRQHDNRHIGNLTAYVDHNNITAELAIMIGDKAAHGFGLGLEAWKTASDWLLSQGGMRKIHAGTMAANTAMLKVFERSGMTVEGRRPDYYLLDGIGVDFVLAGRSNDNMSGSQP